MRVVVTQIESGGTIKRRMVGTAARGDAFQWEEFAGRALAVPLPYLAALSTISARASGISWLPSTTSPGRCGTW